MKKSVLFAAMFVMAFSLTAMAAESGSWTGWISDDHCGAKGNNAGHADCAKQCLAGGAKAVFVVGSDVYALDKQDMVKSHAGHQVKITGKLDKDKKSVAVEKVEMVH